MVGTMMLAATHSQSGSKPKTPGRSSSNSSNLKTTTTKKMKSLSRFFKKEETKKGESSGSGGRDAGSVQLSVTSNNVSGGKRSVKKRQQVINRFVQNERSKSTLLWREGPSQDGDITSEESTSSIQVIAVSKNLSLYKACPVLTSYEEGSAESQSLATPVIKSVRFASPLIDFKVEIESSWDIFPGPQVDTKDKTKATLLDGYMSMHGVDFRLIGYDKDQVVQAQPKVKNYLAPEELAMLRHQKERLAKYRRKLKKKQRKAREDRCHLKGKLAYEALESYKARQDRIIARYKMAAPNAVEHRRRRAIKFALARAAKVVVQVQQRQNFLFSIRDAAQERLQRISARQPIKPLPSVRTQMKRIWIHQATMAALIRLQRLRLLLYEVSCEPVLYQMTIEDYDEDHLLLPQSHSAVDDDECESTAISCSSDSESEYESDSSLDTDDWNYRRLEWAQLAYLAAAKSKEFNISVNGNGNSGRPVEV